MATVGGTARGGCGRITVWIRRVRIAGGAVDGVGGAVVRTGVPVGVGAVLGARAAISTGIAGAWIRNAGSAHAAGAFGANIAIGAATAGPGELVQAIGIAAGGGGFIGTTSDAEAGFAYISSAGAPGGVAGAIGGVGAGKTRGAFIDTDLAGGFAAVLDTFRRIATTGVGRTGRDTARPGTSRVTALGAVGSADFPGAIGVGSRARCFASTRIAAAVGHRRVAVGVRLGAASGVRVITLVDTVVIGDAYPVFRGIALSTPYFAGSRIVTLVAGTRIVTATVVGGAAGARIARNPGPGAVAEGSSRAFTAAAGFGDVVAGGWVHAGIAIRIGGIGARAWKLSGTVKTIAFIDTPIGASVPVGGGAIPNTIESRSPAGRIAGRGTRVLAARPGHAALVAAAGSPGAPFIAHAVARIRITIRILSLIAAVKGGGGTILDAEARATRRDPIAPLADIAGFFVAIASHPAVFHADLIGARESRRAFIANGAGRGGARFLVALILAIVETFNFRAITPFGFALDFFLGLKELLV